MSIVTFTKIWGGWNRVVHQYYWYRKPEVWMHRGMETAKTTED